MDSRAGQQPPRREEERDLGRWSVGGWRLISKPLVFCFCVPSQLTSPWTLRSAERGSDLGLGDLVLKSSCSRWQNAVFHYEKLDLFLCFRCWCSHPGPGTPRQASPGLFLNGPLSFGVHCQAGWKEADVLGREFPSVCPQGDLTAVTLICQDTCPWRGSHLLCKPPQLVLACFRHFTSPSYTCH